MPGNKVDALLALRSGGRLLVGRERIKLLEAVAEHGSITKAAKAAGFSYKTAWESVNAINNLLPTPAFVTKAGGRAGGGAEVTEEGRRLIRTFHRLEERLSQISTIIAEEGLYGQEEAVLWALGARISARNVFLTEVVEVNKGRVDVNVTLKVSETHSILAIVTNDAAVDLDLVPGRRALALVKAPFVRLALPRDVPADLRNWFTGIVTQRHDAERNSEVRLDIEGKTLTAVVPHRSIEKLGIREGKEAAATFDADHVILAVE